MCDIAVVTDSLRSCQHLAVLLFINNVSNINDSFLTLRYNCSVFASLHTGSGNSRLLAL